MGGVNVSSEGSNRSTQNGEEEVLKTAEETFFIKEQYRNKVKGASIEFPINFTPGNETTFLNHSPEITYSRFIRFRSLLL